MSTPNLNSPALAALVPLLPLFTAGLSALLKREQRRFAASLAIGAQTIATAVAVCCSVVFTASAHGLRERTFDFPWLSYGHSEIQLGLLLDPLSLCMAAMVSFVTLLIFIFSLGYMKEDRNFTRFFTFLSLFSAAMLGVVLSNSLLLTFVCWELVGLASYLLIGFWFYKPEAAAAAKKAFLTTRIGDIGFLIGMLWLAHSAGTLLFYNDQGGGCLQAQAVQTMAKTLCGGLAVSNIIALLIFCGAAGKSGQFPLHVWLPDAMEGPTPVSALIHAATMVAAGVYLVARVFPIFTAAGADSTALIVVAWIGAFTALFAALIAVAQTDIKRILAYSTVSQLGFMMLALGVGSVPAAMLHLIGHAFFKALLFLGAGSVIHGVHEEQDIRRMGGLRKSMPITFATYAVGMMALSGVPFLFCGFWSKDAILHAALDWHVSRGPFVLAAAAAILTAFYMTRQMAYVFFGSYRGHAHPHESPRVMTIPLMILAAAAVLFSIPATPFWPWFEEFIAGKADPHFRVAEFLIVAGISIVLVVVGIGFGWRIYGNRELDAESPDLLETAAPPLFRALANRLYVDEFYNATFVRGLGVLSAAAAWIDRWIFSGAVRAVAAVSEYCSQMGSAIDRWFLNFGFDSSCNALQEAGGELAAWHNGRVQGYLRIISLSVVVLIMVIGWLLT